MLHLQQRRGHATAEGRRRGGDRVADEEQPGQRELPVMPALAPVGVQQRAAGEYRGDRARAARVDPGGQARDRLARRAEGGLIPELGQDLVSGGANEQHRERAALHAGR